MTTATEPAGRFRNFHEGEATVQRKAGVDTATFDQMVDEPFRPALSDNEVRFVDALTFSVAASVGGDGRPWATPLFGSVEHNLFTVVDRTTVTIRPGRPDEPLTDNIAATGELGVLYFEPSRRRRAKSMGTATVEDDGSFTYRMSRNFGLCTKYIFKRRHQPDTRPSDPAAPTGTEDGTGEPRTGDRLDDDDRRQLAAADTVFLASHHVGHGSDPTHRGGPPGFVRVLDDRTILLPDYVGNGMFQTLGNLLLDDRLGLMTVDWSTGRTIQVTGHATTRPTTTDDPYAQREVVLAIDEVRTTTRTDVGTWTDLEAFDIQRGLINPGTPYLPTNNDNSGRSPR